MGLLSQVFFAGLLSEVEEKGNRRCGAEQLAVAPKVPALKVPTLPLRADVLLSNSLFQELEGVHFLHLYRPKGPLYICRDVPFPSWTGLVLIRCLSA